MDTVNENTTLQFRPRKTESVSLEMPEDTLASVRKIAANRNMSETALLKFYIGQGLREDIAKQFVDHMMEKTANVLARHLHSEDEVSAILREIRQTP